MARMRISSWMAAGFLVVGCGGESRTAAENESCFGPAPAGNVVAKIRNDGREGQQTADAAAHVVDAIVNYVRDH